MDNQPVENIANALSRDFAIIFSTDGEAPLLGSDGQVSPSDLKNLPAMLPTFISETKVDSSIPPADEPSPVVMSQADASQEQTESPVMPFHTVGRSLEEIPVERLRSYYGVHPFRTKTFAERPLVVCSPSGYSCIDGHEIVRAAVDAGMTSVLCEVDIIEEESDGEMGLRVLETRTATRGEASYAELVLAHCQCRDILLASNQDLRVFQHGGKRTGKDFSADRVFNVTNILAERTQKKDKTISNYFTHGEHIDLPTMLFLIEHEAGKDFFVAVTRKKRGLVRELKEKRLPYADLVSAVSATVRTFFAEYKPPERGEGRRKRKQAPVDSSAGSVAQQTDAAGVGIVAADDKEDSGPSPLQRVKNRAKRNISLMVQRIEEAGHFTEVDDCLQRAIKLIEDLREFNQSEALKDD